MNRNFRKWNSIWVGSAIAFAFLVLATCPGSAVAQTNTFPATGNVGVGTTSPAVPLDLKGNNVPWGGQLRLQAPDWAQISFYNSNNPALGQANRLGSIAYDMGTSSLFIDSSIGNKRLLLQALGGGGNVGIGTTNPLFKLHVAGRVIGEGVGSGNNAFVDFGKLNTPGSGEIGFQIGRTGLTSGVAVFQGAKEGIGANDITFQPSGGNVGIGTTSPGARLDIGGGNLRVQSGTLDLNNQIRDDSINLFGGYYTLGIRPWTFYAKTAQKFRFESALADSNQSAYELGSTGGATFFAVKNDGKVGIGTSNPTKALDVVGDINVSGNINAKYQDVAEWVESSQELLAGTLVVLDHTKSNQVIASSQAYDTRVAGVISAQPGITLGESGDNKVLVATTGRVVLAVDASKGPIQIGDLLVTSDIAGVAMKSEAINVGGVQIHRPGTLIGKALEPLAKGQGKILVLLSLQ